ncbi:MAG: tetratricopeptide repeat protein [Planctomycetota bacterium]|jgi:tetratricopeptide (TPR) repeat protein
MKCVHIGLVVGVGILGSCSALFGDRGPRRAAPSEGDTVVNRAEEDGGNRRTPVVPKVEAVASSEMAFLPNWVHPSARDQERSRGLVEALRFLEDGETERAAVQLQQVRSAGGFGSEVTALHAWALAEAGELNAASAIAREGIAVFGATPALGYVMAVVFEAQGEPQEALPLYRDLSTLAPQDLAMLEACARTAVGARHGAEALSFLDRWMLAEPLGIDGKRLRAQALQLSGRPDDALALYRQMLGEWPQDHVLLAEMTEAVYETSIATQQPEHLEQAAELLQQLTDLDPQRSSAFRRLGFVQARLSRPNEAIEALERCLELEPGDVEAGLELASLHAAKADTDAAGEILLNLLRQPLAAAEVESVQSALLELR